VKAVAVAEGESLAGQGESLAGQGESLAGQVVEVEVGPVAHGGHCVARHDGRVIFVRHAIPGERVTAVVTEGHEASRYLRADAVEVLRASPDRVSPPCPYAGPGRCGGCDFQHVALPHQRALKAAVVREQLQRLARLDVPVEVEAVPGDRDGLGWRTRVSWSATPDGRPGLLRHRSDVVVPIERCLIAHPDLPDAHAALAAGTSRATAVISSTGDAVVVGDRHGGTVTEHAAGRDWLVGAGEFWQVHPGAAEALVAAALEGLQPQPGERCWDLFAGVGLFSGVLAEAVGPSGAVVSVESHRRASRLAERNLVDLPQVRMVAERVGRFVRSRIAQGRLDLVLLDPPRSGAGRDVVRRIAAQGPRAVAYVACDPAALARDLATFAEEGYRLTSLRAFDLFPMTHHVECVAIVRRDG
jgi:tRNA/tmRNA/rRNA uracil-C5-methylase (TrmA/RlmC/RlmD family)